MPRTASREALVYPLDPNQEGVARAETRGPWRTPADNLVRFMRLPVEPADAIRQLAEEPLAAVP
jgi:hypothetical protein